MDQNEKKIECHKHQTIGLSVGMCFGVSIGLAMGYAFNTNTPTLGMCFGLPIGMCVGMAIGAAHDKRINEQIAEKGYTIQTISNNDTSSNIVIVDKDGNEHTVIVNNKVVTSEKLAVGDLVYLDPNGTIEQISDK